MQPEPTPEEFRTPLFITGCMRSGTTLLVDKLTMHPQLLKIGQELNWAWTEIGNAPCLEKCEHRSSDDFSPNHLASMASYYDFFIKDAQSFRRYLMRSKNKIGKGIGRISYDWQNIIPVNKSPHFMNKIGYLSTMFPKSKFLFIIRSINGHCSSMKPFLKRIEESGIVPIVPNKEKDCWSMIPKSKLTGQQKGNNYWRNNFKSIPQMWINLNYHALTEFDKLGSKNVQFLNYETLVRNQQIEFERIFGFLKLNKNFKSEEKKIGTEVLKFKNTTTKGDPLLKWKDQLSEDEIHVIKTVLTENKEKVEYIKEKIPNLKFFN